MLPERITQLLTAYIDGELSTRQRKHVTKLLRKSREARKLLKEMQHDSLILQRLPRKKMKQDLSQTLPGTIKTRGLQLPTPKPAAPAPAPRQVGPAVRSGVPAWVALVVGALLLGVVAAGSYMFFGTTPEKKPTTQSAPR